MMSVHFPRPEFFEALKRRIADDPSSMEGAGDSNAYCGFVTDERLIVLEFDGQQCAAVVSGGNLIDLDFALAGTAETWKDMMSAISKHGGADQQHTLEALVETGALKILTDAPDGLELARGALGFLQVFLDQAKHLQIEFD